MHVKTMPTVEITSIGTPGYYEHKDVQRSHNGDRASMGVAEPRGSPEGNIFLSRINIPLVKPKKKLKNCTTPPRRC
ncbi:MAG TPA: hypothetical protein EYP23_02050 [Thermoplasmata archaeon]|nr:hypothetical protein [Thermoplasmata archaeon]